MPEPDANGDIDPNDLPDTLPGYLINLTAELTIDDQEQSSVAAGTMGTELYENLALWQPFSGWENAINYPIAGEYNAIALNLQGMSVEEAQRLQAEIVATQTALESGDNLQIEALTKHQVVGDLLYATIYSYFALNDVQDQIAANSANYVSYRLPSFGKFRANIIPQYWFGVPRNAIFSGLTMDVDLVTLQGDDKNHDQEKHIGFNRNIGNRYSAMEHLVPEQMFSSDGQPTNGVSAVKAIALAAQEGQRIYTIVQANLEAALNEIVMPNEVEAEIRNAVIHQGLEVTIHEAPIDFFGRSSLGYIVLDPETGAGAYKIGGGSNGSDDETEKDSSMSIFGISEANASDATHVKSSIDVMNCVIQNVVGLIADILFFKGALKIKNLKGKWGIFRIIALRGLALFGLYFLIAMIAISIISHTIDCLLSVSKGAKLNASREGWV